MTGQRSGSRSRRAVMRRLGATIALALLVGHAFTAAAEEGKEPPIEIEADSGIEWRQREKIVFARGNAKAARGPLVLRADVLSARYRERTDGSTDIWRIEADGAVRITRPGETLEGDHAIYEVEPGVLTLTGRKVRLITADSEITADQSLEYAARSRTLSARGNAEARQGARIVRGETLTALLRDGEAASSGLKRIEAVRNVVVITRGEVMRGDHGIYDLDAQRATLTGAVRITRGDNQLNGCRGELDLASGVGRLFACPGAAGEAGRVRGLIVPDGGRKE